MSAIACPVCGAKVGVENINIREGVALCPSCGRLTRLGELAEDPALIGVAEGEPPRGCWIRDDGVETRVGASSRSVGGFLGALFFTVFWNGIVGIFVLVAAAGTWQHLVGPLPAWVPGMAKGGNAPMSLGMVVFLWVFLTPFITVGLVMAGVTLVSLAGKVELRLRQAEGSVFVGVGSLGWRRRFDAGAVKRVHLNQTLWKQNDQSKEVVVIEAERRVAFGSMLTDERRRWLAAAAAKLLRPRAG
ncbi:hypothetical protein PHYC_03931 [Phycisphaerales bacterium]|nr:hypothetical protein PHYC_03931 [Phycisphaerales bacterium]